MTNAGLRPDKTLPSEPNQPSAASEPVTFDAYRSVIRLLVGLALIGGDDLVKRLRDWETAHPPDAAGAARTAEPESAADQARHALIGLVFVAADTARQAVYGIAGLPAAFAGAMGSLLRPVADSFLFRPMASSVRSIVPRQQERLARYTQIGRAEEQRSRGLAGEVTGLLLEDIVDYAGTNPGVLALVDAQVDRLLPSLAANPDVLALVDAQVERVLPALGNDPATDALVRLVGDRYIAYLNEHPDAVQNLVTGQAMGMASEMRDNVRVATVTGDTALEMLVRSLLRRKPRADLPPPNIPQRNGSEPEADETEQGGGAQ